VPSLCQAAEKSLIFGVGVERWLFKFRQMQDFTPVLRILSLPEIS